MQPFPTTFPEREGNESDESYYGRIRSWLVGEDVRSKVDLREWTGSPKFHLDRAEAPKRGAP